MGFLSSVTSFAGPAMTIAGIATGNPMLMAAGVGVGALGANMENREAARSMMNFQERMSNTAHQREMRDLYAAGLNPILSARYGGASTPGGASYIAKNTAEAAANSGLALQRQNADIDLVKQQTFQAQSSAYNYGADTDKKNQEMRLIREQVKTEVERRNELEASARSLNANAAIGEQTIESVMNKADIDRTSAGKVLRWLNAISESVQGARGAVAPGRSSRPLSKK